jgi:hypothetical protein
MTETWTVEQVRYNFYVPPVLFDQRDIPPGLSYPVPNKPVTPFPGLVKYLPPDRASEAPKGHHTARMQPNPHSAKMLNRLRRKLLEGRTFDTSSSVQNRLLTLRFGAAR